LYIIIYIYRYIICWVCRLVLSSIVKISKYDNPSSVSLLQHCCGTNHSWDSTRLSWTSSFQARNGVSLLHSWIIVKVPYWVLLGSFLFLLQVYWPWRKRWRAFVLLLHWVGVGSSEGSSCALAHWWPWLLCFGRCLLWDRYERSKLYSVNFVVFFQIWN
jgi:hypothetical protein